jgi:hemoglobin-like flavoprotein
MILTAPQLDAVRGNLRTVSPHFERLSTLFFARLFTAHSVLRPLFPQDAYRRAEDLLAALEYLTRNAHRLDAVEGSLVDFGARNERAGIQPVHYGAAREALLFALADVSGAQWNADLREAWATLLQVVSSVALRGAGRARARAA